MSGVSLALLTLGASLPLAVLGLLAGLLAERITPASAARERMWSLAFLLPAAGAVAIPLLAPHLIRTVAPVMVGGGGAGDPVLAAALPHPAPTPLGDLIDLVTLLAPTVLLGVILLGAAVALGLILRRHVRLAVLMHQARDLEDPSLKRAIAARALALRVRAPALKVSLQAASPLLAGVLRPAIVIPRPLTALPTERLMLICGHELAHLKRGDNPRGWGEALILAVFWFNPLMAMIHGRLAAAREEHCDAIALAGADEAARRAYAQALIETLRLRAGPEPHSAFIGAGRKTAMRLQAILQPRQSGGRRAAIGVVAVAAVLVAAVGAGSVALAMQAAPAKGRASVWRQSSQDGPSNPKGQITIAADVVETRPGNVTIWRGRPVIELKAATGNPRRDAELAKVVFLVDGHAVADDFTPKALNPEKIALIEVTGPEQPGEGPSTVNVVMLAPPAPPAPPAPLAARPPAPAPPPPPPVMSIDRVAPPAPPAHPAPPPPPAPPAPPPPLTWEQRPSGADIAAVYPSAAAERGVSGQAVIGCGLQSDGSLTRCRIISEAPADAGFGQAALKLTPKFRARAGADLEASVVRLPIRFQLSPSAPKTEADQARMRSESKRRFAGTDARAFKRYCTAGDEQERAFCAGVLFAVSNKGGACPPSNEDPSRLVTRSVAKMSGIAARNGGDPAQYAMVALARAYPCV